MLRRLPGDAFAERSSTLATLLRPLLSAYFHVSSLPRVTVAFCAILTTLSERRSRPGSDDPRFFAAPDVAARLRNHRIADYLEHSR
jgi:CRP-like cAMP-binding protein